MNYLEIIADLISKIKNGNLIIPFKIEANLDGKRIILEKSVDIFKSYQKKKYVFDIEKYVVFNLTFLINFLENQELNELFFEYENLENVQYFAYIKQKNFDVNYLETVNFEIEKFVPFFLELETFKITVEWINNPSIKLNWKSVKNWNINLKNHIWLQTLEIPWVWSFKFRVFPKKNDFYESVDKILQKIDKIYFWWVFTNEGEVGWKWDYKLVEALLTSSSQKLLDKIKYFYNQIKLHPIKKTKLVVKWDIKKEGLTRKNLYYIKSQRHNLIPWWEDSKKNFNNQNQSTNVDIHWKEVSLKRVKHYEKVDNFDIPENRYIKRLLHQNYMYFKNSGDAKLAQFFYRLLSTWIFKNVKLDLLASKTSKIDLNQNYLNLEKYLKDFVKVDILDFLNRKNIKTFNDLYEVYCFIKMGEIFLSEEAKRRGWEVVGSIKDIYRNWKFENCDKILPIDCEFCLKLKYNWKDVKLTFWWNLKRKNWLTSVTPDYILDFWDKKIIFDAKYSVEYYPEADIIGVVKDRFTELYTKYWLQADPSENVKWVILLYPNKDVDKKTFNFIDLQIKNKIVMFPIDEFDEKDFYSVSEKFFDIIENMLTI